MKMFHQLPPDSPKSANMQTYWSAFFFFLSRNCYPQSNESLQLHIKLLLITCSFSLKLRETLLISRHSLLQSTKLRLNPTTEQRENAVLPEVHVIKTGLLTSMHEMSARTVSARTTPLVLISVVLLVWDHLLRTRPERSETQSRCLLFSNSSAVSQRVTPTNNMADSGDGSRAGRHLGSWLKWSDSRHDSCWQENTALLKESNVSE